jgi:putative transposase
MCGIVGYLDKTGTRGKSLGKTLLAMLNALACRGPDSAGVALFGPSRPNPLFARVKMGGNGDEAKRVLEIKMLAQTFGAEEFGQKNEYLRFLFQDSGDLKPFISSIEWVARDVEIVSIGQRLEIVKQVGSPIVSALRQVEAGAGARVDDICRKVGISQATYYLWKRKYTGVGVSELRELRQLREEVGRLRRLVADLRLDRQML